MENDMNVFEKALEVLRERGWQNFSGSLEGAGGGLCILGACSVAKYGMSEDAVYEDDEILDPLKKVLLEQFEITPSEPGMGGSVFVWNDSYERTQDEVEMVLEKAAQL